jgi:hypothetical protein
MPVYSVMGPGGAPAKPPYGSFAGKPPFIPGGRPYTHPFSVMGPAGAPMMPPYGSFANKLPFLSVVTPPAGGGKRKAVRLGHLQWHQLTEQERFLMEAILSSE